MIALQRRVISNVSFLHHSLILRTKMVEVLQQKMIFRKPKLPIKQSTIACGRWKIMIFPTLDFGLGWLWGSDTWQSCHSQQFPSTVHLSRLLSVRLTLVANLSLPASFSQADPIIQLPCPSSTGKVLELSTHPHLTLISGIMIWRTIHGTLSQIGSQLL